MMDYEAPAYKNNLLNSFSASDFKLIISYLEPILLPRFFYVAKASDPISHLYFLEAGIVSTVAVMGEKREIEIGVTGREGVSGTAVVLGTDRTPHDCYMQMAGHGNRIQSDHMRKLMAKSPTMTTSMLAFVNAFLIQQQATAHVNGTVNLRQRLARWLLMVQDRSDDDTFPITHDFLSVMLGVRRPGVTVGLQILEGEGLIRSLRGRIIILKRKALIESTRGSYGSAEREYARLVVAKFARV